MLADGEQSIEQVTHRPMMIDSESTAHCVGRAIQVSTIDGSRFGQVPARVAGTFKQDTVFGT